MPKFYTPESGVLHEPLWTILTPKKTTMKAIPIASKSSQFATTHKATPADDAPALARWQKGQYQ